MPMNGYGPNQGYPPYGRPQRPVNAGNPYVAQPQHHGPMNTGNNYQVPPQLRPPAAHGRKRAVLCGINYKGHKQSLQGSINDVLLMKNLLVGKLGFPNASVLVLTGFSFTSTKFVIFSYLNVETSSPEVHHASTFNALNHLFKLKHVHT